MGDINLEAVLLEALDDERKAEATYAAVIRKFGEVRPFTNIIAAERRHSAAIERQMVRLGFPIPTNHWKARAQPPPRWLRLAEWQSKPRLRTSPSTIGCCPQFQTMSSCRYCRTCRMHRATITCRHSAAASNGRKAAVEVALVRLTGLGVGGGEAEAASHKSAGLVTVVLCHRCYSSARMAMSS